MGNLNLHIFEERENVFSFFRDCSKLCLSDLPETNRAFYFLYETWEKVSDDLWKWCYWQDYFRCGQIVLSTANTINNTVVEVQLLSELGWLYLEWQDFIKAEEYFNRGLQKSELLKDNKQESRLFRYLGVLFHRQDDLSSALNYYQKSLQIVVEESAKNQGEKSQIWLKSEAELRNVLGSFYLKLKNFDTSYKELSLSLAKYRSLGDEERYYQTAPLLNLGDWHLAQQDYNLAQKYYQECLELSKEISRPDMEAGALLKFAELAKAQENNQQALQFAIEAEKVAGTEVVSVREKAARFKEQIIAHKFQTSDNI
ncbi:MAG: tetratricopeptide repeat protein [Microcoleaceae cyanobacterium]